MLSKIRNYLIGSARWLYSSESGKKFLSRIIRTPPGRLFAISQLEKVQSPFERRVFIEAIQILNGTKKQRAKFIAAARKQHEANLDSVARFDVLIIALLHSEDHEQAFSTLTSPEAEEFLDENSAETNIFGARISLYHELEQYRRALTEVLRAIDLVPDSLRSRLDYLKCAFAAGKMLRQRDAIELFGRQYNIIGDHPGRATDREIESVVESFAKSTIYTLKDSTDFLKLVINREPKIGVFFLSSTEALGHAILDPYHFLALYRDRFDRVVFIGPPKASYRPASRACLQIVEQYGDYIETNSDILLNLSWMGLGHHQVGRITLIVDHYWALLRTAVHRTCDEADDFRHNTWHFELPPYYTTVGEAFCRQSGIDLGRPIVVMHVRDSGYHGIVRQSFRDSAVGLYRKSVKYLLECGYQVIRIGDDKMPKLDLDHNDYHEIPFEEGYRHELDSFFISRSRFLIGCQSGPCSFARALGTPILTINGVLHYTLLPSTKEMTCFKRYYRTGDCGRTELSLFEALDARVDQFDNAYQFEKAKIVVESASADEILAATRDMDAWIDNPRMKMTKAQREFADRVEEQMVTLQADQENLPIAIADYIGIYLDGFRISPSVAKMRQRKKNDTHQAG